MIKRGDIAGLDRARKTARDRLMGNILQTRETMRPANIIGRWKMQQMRRLETGAKKLKSSAKSNKGLLIGLAAGILLVAARRPIIAAAKKLNGKFGKS